MKLRVLMVCTGNICRSPTAEVVLRDKLRQAGLEAQVEVDSAGTHGYYHAGEAPDERAQAHARRRGYDLSTLRAREMEEGDFQGFDLILAMGRENLDYLQSRARPEWRSKIRGLTAFGVQHKASSVPDPYSGGRADFERVLDLVEDACDGLVVELRQRLSKRPHGERGTS